VNTANAFVLRGATVVFADSTALSLMRLPLFYELSEADQHRITDEVLGFYQMY
jgi:dTDP-4-amino-4,6-dideoxygalactose transaminase